MEGNLLYLKVTNVNWGHGSSDTAPEFKPKKKKNALSTKKKKKKRKKKKVQ
jgi:hypothetical protein